jgi:hypothetical protein
MAISGHLYWGHCLQWSGIEERARFVGISNMIPGYERNGAHV